MRQTLCLVVVCAPLLVSPDANASQTGTITGVVRPIPRPPSSSTFNAYPGHAHEQVMPEAEATDNGFADVVVYLEKDPSLPLRPSAVPPPKHPELTQSGMRFVPRVLPILAGQSVDFPNRDPFYHNVFSYSSTKRFDLGRYAEGGNGTVSFPEPGEVRVFCDIHSDMNAVILVLPNQFFAQPDSAGRFRLESVPAGPHRLTLWHPDFDAQSIEVVVSSEPVTHLELGF
ncbi:MAG: hypothetical protein R3E12_17190 [Candidatus Eisenbacteria bacterium]